MISLDAQLERIKRRTVDIIPEADLLEQLKRFSRGERGPLRVKLGVDPTAPDIHLGISIVLQKLRDFQELGHTAVLIVGDFTARIGDPSERDVTRPMLSAKAIERNMASYREQAFEILDPKLTEFRYNSEWLDPLTFQEVLELTSRYTVARMLERDDFEQRFKAGNPISLREFLYPLAQAYDSVVTRADVELGGTDQRFNLLVGREIQARYQSDQLQTAVIMPLLEGTDGVKKMSKSYGNYVGITEAAEEMFGKLMSIPDELLEKYATLLTELGWPALRERHPMEAKKAVAWAIVERYHGEEAASGAQAEFERVFSEGAVPAEMPELRLFADILDDGNAMGILELLEASGHVKSRSEARRLIDQGGVSLGGERISSSEAQVHVADGLVLRVGKRRFTRIVLRDGSPS